MVQRAYTILLTAALLALPASAGHSTESQPQLVSDAAFEGSFAHLETLPAAPQPAAGAVDIGSITPAVETTSDDDGEAIRGGVASYYGKKFHGRRTASGESFDMNAMTAAHRTLPFGSKVRVTNSRTGKSVVVRINDRGPFHGKRVIDVSRAAATELGLIARGHGNVNLALLDS